ncbi:MAG TPA: XRE family transcriptional regulator [Gemmatimonadales bacterium]|jgi:predicted XRE-type DNA-binding protein
MAIKITKGSGNVFRDLGLPSVEAEHLRVRAELMLALERWMKHRRLTQARAAKLLGVSQPRVNDLVRGRLHRFSIDALVDMLARAGVRVHFTTQRRARVA